MSMNVPGCDCPGCTADRMDWPAPYASNRMIESFWMPDASLACSVCGDYTNHGAVHVCDVETVDQAPSCLNVCPACVAIIAASVPDSPRRPAV